MVISCLPISSEKKTGSGRAGLMRRWRSPAPASTSRERACAATTTIWPGWRPLVKFVEFGETGRDAGHPAAALTAGLDLVDRRLQERLEDAVVLGVRRSVTS